MIQGPLVSVIIPAYNCADFIGKSIDSALSQTYKNIEIIVVNDGSTDKTLEVLSQFKGKIKVISRKNGGVAAARNTGIVSAKGKYIANLDADDRWYEDRLEKMIPILEKNEVDILISNCYLVDENWVKLNDQLGIPLNFNVPKTNQFEWLLNSTTMFTFMIVSKKLVLSVDGYDEELRGDAEDYDLWLRMLKEEAKFDIVLEPLAEYMIRSNSLTHTFSESRVQSIRYVYYKHIDRYGEKYADHLFKYHSGQYIFSQIVSNIKQKKIISATKFLIRLIITRPAFLIEAMRRLLDINRWRGFLMD